MEPLVDILKRGSRYGFERIGQCTSPDLSRVQDFAGPGPVLDGTDAELFFAQWIQAWDSGKPVLVVDPSWPQAWWRQILDAWLGDAFVKSDEPAIWLPRGGSSGQPRFCLHTDSTLSAAINAYWHRFPRSAVDAEILLPLHSVGGLLSVLRAWSCRGVARMASYRNWIGEDLPVERPSVTSLVPTQLKRLWKDPAGLDFLRQRDIVFVGGGGINPEWADLAERDDVSLAPCYGATETAAMIVSHDPSTFLAEEKGVGQALPGVDLEISAEGRLVIRTPTLCRAVWPETNWDGIYWEAPDLGAISGDGYVEIHGRADRVIISGGKKIVLEPLESALCQSGRIEEALLVGVPDEEWGERLIAFVSGEGLEQAMCEELLLAKFPRWMLPKEWYFGAVPLSDRGKPDWRLIHEKLHLQG